MGVMGGPKPAPASSKALSKPGGESVRRVIRAYRLAVVWLAVGWLVAGSDVAVVPMWPAG